MKATSYTAQDHKRKLNIKFRSVSIVICRYQCQFEECIINSRQRLKK